MHAFKCPRVLLAHLEHYLLERLVVADVLLEVQHHVCVVQEERVAQLVQLPVTAVRLLAEYLHLDCYVLEQLRHLQVIRRQLVLRLCQLVVQLEHLALERLRECFDILVNGEKMLQTRLGRPAVFLALPHHRLDRVVVEQLTRKEVLKALHLESDRYYILTRFLNNII